jgi:hypothetical protein
MGQEGPDGFEEPVEGVAHLVGVVCGGGQVSVDILDGGFHDVQRVSQLFQLTSSHDELGVAESELLGSNAGFVLPLAA